MAVYVTDSMEKAVDRLKQNREKFRALLCNRGKIEGSGGEH